MSTNSNLKLAIQLALGVSTGVLAVSAPSVFAQDADADVEDNAMLEEVIITGTRIPLDQNQVASSPVTTVGSEELTYSGVTRVEDLVNNMPQLVPELTANDSNGSTGTATLDLRGLGSNRTLVLTNGHRMGFGDPFALAPDINQIPGNLIERVEILTGGASSTYGSDAVAGVVNFIMKSDFEGFQFDAQYSGYQHKNDNQAAQDAIDAAGYEQAPNKVNDGEMVNLNAIWGINSADGRANVTAYIGYRDIKAIRHSERDYSACALGDSDATKVGSCIGSSTIPQGRFTDFGASIVPGGPDTSFDVMLDPSGDFVPRAGTTYNYGPLNYFQRPDQRWTGGMFAHYDVTDDMEVYGEFQFMDDRSLAQIAPSGTFFNNNDLNCDNPLMSQQQLDAIGCTGPDDRVPAYVGKRNVEGGPRYDDLTHTSWRSLIGLRGNIGDNWTYDAFANYAKLNYTEVYNNDLSISNIVKALEIVDDGNGNAVCRSFLDGSDPLCVPYNVFQPGGITQEAIDYISLPLYSKANMSMTQYNGYVTGDLGAYGVTVPWADEGVQLVLGAEYRQDRMVFDLDNNYNNGNAAGQGGATADVSGEVSVQEWFIEARVPLLQNRAFFTDLSLDLRYRNSSYNSGIDADTWNVGLGWSVTDSWKLRGSVSQAVRAPNINELFQPQTIGLWQGTDPCATSTPELSEAECARTGVPDGFYGFVSANPASQYNGKFGGNPDLGPETSDSWTVGVLWTPENVSGLSVSVDYWSIEVEDAIDNIDPEFIIRQCAGGIDFYCPLINRNPINGNVWVGSGPDAPHVLATNINIGFFAVAGVDLNANYLMDVGNHGLNFTLRGTYMTKWDDQPLPGGVVNDLLGTWGNPGDRPIPEWKHTFSTLWVMPFGLDMNVNWRYIGKADQFGGDGFNAKAKNFFDVALSYNVNWGNHNVLFTGGINNIFDTEPNVHGLFNDAAYSNGNTIPGTWDPLGRYWFIGATYTID
jgi:outer membrane receptor protein involved in Fe transport